MQTVPSILVEQPGPMPPLRKRGRPKNSGSRIKMLQQMKVGVPVFGFSFNEMKSTRNASYRLGVQIETRSIPDTDKYAIRRLT
jgi:hypothetical protein